MVESMNVMKWRCIERFLFGLVLGPYNCYDDVSLSSDYGIVPSLGHVDLRHDPPFGRSCSVAKSIPLLYTQRHVRPFNTTAQANIEAPNNPTPMPVTQ